MEIKRDRLGALGKIAGALLVLWLLGLGPAWAGSIVVDGVKVTYPYAFDAYYDPGDGTLTIAIYEEGGNLQVKALPWASSYWGSYVDVYIGAGCVDVPSITLKGRPDVRFYVTGGVGWASKLSINNGSVGNTDYYGDQGLGMYWTDWPSISIKNGYATGAVLYGSWWSCP